MKFKPLFDILITYLLFFIVLILAVFLKSSLAILVALAIFLSLILHRLGLFIHAAAHTEFHQNLDKNDFLYKIYLGWFFGTNLQNYRRVHFAHHKYHGSNISDPEDTYSNGFNLKKLLKLILRTNEKSIILKDGSRQSLIGLQLLAFLVHGTILTSLIFYLGVRGGAFYLVSIFIGLPLITHLRNCLEHTPLGNEEVVSRNFSSGLWSFFLGAAGFRLHDEHHKFPKLKYWELDSKVTKVSYVQTFLRILI